MHTLLVAVALLAPTGQPASNQDADEAALVGQSGDVRIYDFEDDTVEGEVLSPEGANITSRGRVKHESLIRIRPHFIPELIRLANDI